jgi:hypothetical protein
MRTDGPVSVLTTTQYVVGEYDQRTGDMRWQRVVNATQKEGIHNWLREHFPTAPKGIVKTNVVKAAVVKAPDVKPTEVKAPVGKVVKAPVASVSKAPVKAPVKTSIKTSAKTHAKTAVVKAVVKPSAKPLALKRKAAAA